MNPVLTILFSDGVITGLGFWFFGFSDKWTFGFSDNWSNNSYKIVCSAFSIVIGFLGFLCQLLGFGFSG